MGPSPCCATSVKREAPPVISNSHHESVGFQFLLTPPPLPLGCTVPGAGGGGGLLQKSTAPMASAKTVPLVAMEL